MYSPEGETSENQKIIHHLSSKPPSNVSNHVEIYISEVTVVIHTGINFLLKSLSDTVSNTSGLVNIAIPSPVTTEARGAWKKKLQNEDTLLQSSQIIRPPSTSQIALESQTSLWGDVDYHKRVLPSTQYVRCRSWKWALGTERQDFRHWSRSYRKIPAFELANYRSPVVLLMIMMYCTLCPWTIQVARCEQFTEAEGSVSEAVIVEPIQLVWIITVSYIVLNVVTMQADLTFRRSDQQEGNLRRMAMLIPFSTTCFLPRAWFCESRLAKSEYWKEFVWNPRIKLGRRSREMLMRGFWYVTWK